MSLEFNKQLCFGLIFSNKLTEFIVQEVSGRMDGFISTVEDDNLALAISDLSKLVYEKTDLKINPKQWRLFNTIKQIDKEWEMNCYMTICEDPIPESDKYKMISIKDIPGNCVPNIYWLAPMAIDLSILSSGFNQIIVRE